MMSNDPGNVYGLAPAEATIQARLLAEGLQGAAFGDADVAFDRLTELARRSSDITVLLMVTNFIAAVSLGNPEAVGRFAALEMYEAGVRVNPDQYGADPESGPAVEAWCGRLIVATANQDLEQMFALIGTTPSSEVAQARMANMVAIAGRLYRAELEKAKVS